MKKTSLQWLLSLIGTLIILVKIFLPTLDLSTILIGVSFILLALLLPHATTAEIGGVKITLDDVEQSNNLDKVPSASVLTESKDKPAYLFVLEKDPNLALVGLRIEIEKRVRKLAALNGIKNVVSLTELANQLSQGNFVEQSFSSDLLKIIRAGNKAAHGANVEVIIQEWTVNEGQTIIFRLDNLISEFEIKDSKEQLEKAMTILDFHGDGIKAVIWRILNFLVHNKYMKLHEYESKTQQASDILMKLEAIKSVPEIPDSVSRQHYIITEFGKKLHQYLIYKEPKIAIGE